MVNVSETYNPYTAVRDVDVLVDFDAVNTDAAEHATFTANDYNNISIFSNLTNGNKDISKYATCEAGLTMLDGSWSYLPTTITTQEIGWWSESIADENGDFANTPTLTGTLSSQYDCVGFTVFSDTEGNGIKEAIVTAYSNNTTVYSQRFYSNSRDMVIDLPANDFDKVILQVIKGTPNRRIKLNEFKFGILKQWNRNSIVSVKIDEAGDVAGEALPIKKATVEFDNSTHEFDITGSTKKYVNTRAMETATITFSDINSVSRPSQLFDNVIDLSNYATSENSYTMLNGEWMYLPNNNSGDYQVAYISNSISDNDGEFSSSPTITYTWSNKLEISGVRFLFEKNNYPKTINIYAYENNTLIGSTTITDNTNHDLTVNFATYNCDKLVLEFNDMNNGNRFLKIAEIELLRYADSWFNYLAKDYPLSINFVINGEKVFMGNKYYFETVKTRNGGLTAEITAHDFICQLDDQRYTHGSNTTINIRDFINDIFSGTGININYDFVGSPTINRTVPKNDTKRNALQLGSQATCHTCWLTRNDVFKVTNLDVGTTIRDTFNSSNLYSMDILNLSDYITQVRLEVNNEYLEEQRDPTIYTSGSGGHYREITNDCVNSSLGQSVADWLLAQKKRRLFFEMECRGNPALEIGDTIRITDKNGTSYLAVIYEQKFEYDGGLKSTVLAIA
ncbi:MAG: hypothetical protein IKQ46_10605 [Bacteroidales bacterium]|nr:hypothetical protein [Bacteroidales bacterium]